MASGSAFSNVLKAKEDLQKSPEQLEQEKRSILSQRVPALQLDGKTKQDLIEQVSINIIIKIIWFYSIKKKAKQFHNVLQQLHGAIYELTERFERQKYDVWNRIYLEINCRRFNLDGRINWTCSSNWKRVNKSFHRYSLHYYIYRL